MTKETLFSSLGVQATRLHGRFLRTQRRENQGYSDGMTSSVSRVLVPDPSTTTVNRGHWMSDPESMEPGGFDVVKHIGEADAREERQRELGPVVAVEMNFREQVAQGNTQ